MQRLLRVGVLLLALLAFVGCGAGANQTPAPAANGALIVASESEMVDTGGAAPKEGDLAPDFVYTLPDGTEQRLSDLRGKKVLINFWATWCAPCRLEMPALQAASTRFADDGLVVLGVNKAEQQPDVVAFGNEFGLTFPLITNTDADIAESYAATFIPMSYFINSDGTVAKAHLGVLDENEIAAQIEAMR
jgi:thiol-disulfide isomerase/thioredoxin